MKSLMLDSVQLSHSVVSSSLQPHGLQDSRLLLSITNSWSLLKLMSVESVMLSNYLILCLLHFLLPTIFPRIMVFRSESVLLNRWPKYCSFSFSISPSNQYSGRFPLGWTGWISLLSKGFSRVFSNTTVQKHQFFSSQPSLYFNSHIHT